MVKVKQGEESVIIVRLTEDGKTEYSGRYILRFVSLNTKQETLIWAVDGSSYPINYNLFQVVLGIEEGEYRLEVWESLEIAEPAVLDITGLKLLQRTYCTVEAPEPDHITYTDNPGEDIVFK